MRMDMCIEMCVDMCTDMHNPQAIAQRDECSMMKTSLPTVREHISTIASIDAGDSVPVGRAAGNGFLDRQRCAHLVAACEAASIGWCSLIRCLGRSAIVKPNTVTPMERCRAAVTALRCFGHLKRVKEILKYANVDFEVNRLQVACCPPRPPLSSFCPCRLTDVALPPHGASFHCERTLQS